MTSIGHAVTGGSRLSTFHGRPGVSGGAVASVIGSATGNSVVGVDQVLVALGSVHGLIPVGLIRGGEVELAHLREVALGRVIDQKRFTRIKRSEIVKVLVCFFWKGELLALHHEIEKKSLPPIGRVIRGHPRTGFAKLLGMRVLPHTHDNGIDGNEDGQNTR